MGLCLFILSFVSRVKESKLKYDNLVQNSEIYDYENSSFNFLDYNRMVVSILTSSIENYMKSIRFVQHRISSYAFFVPVCRECFLVWKFPIHSISSHQMLVYDRKNVCFNVPIEFFRYQLRTNNNGDEYREHFHSKYDRCHKTLSKNNNFL